MRRSLLLLVALPAVAVPAAGAVPHGSSAACPRRALPLTANSIAPASRVALAREQAGSRPQVTGAIFARDDRIRGPYAKTECGAKAQARTIVVYIDLRAYHPSASLSERVSFVARFRNGYRVWEIVH
jgi:hypothetical protein